MNMQDTICAISTPPGIGGIAVIRVSGAAACALVDRIYTRDLLSLEANKVQFGQIRVNDEVIDEVLVSKFLAPHSFTGEDIVEISCHGSVFVQEQIITALLDVGCRMASNGEFSQRAFLHGKVDLSQAEAIGDLIASESAAAHRLAIRQMKGSFKTEIAGFRDKLIEFASLTELELDFSEEDVEFADRSKLKKLLQDTMARCQELMDSFRLGRAIKNGIPVAIIGAPNSGKSTLLNALLKEDRAIVSDIAGTTRDAIEETLRYRGYQLRFIDTAGLRDTDDIIEGEGIRIAKGKADLAEIVLLLNDITAEKEENKALTEIVRGLPKDSRLLRVGSKSDLSRSSTQSTDTNDIAISAKTGTGIKDLLDLIVKDFDGHQEERLILTNQRHYEAFSKVSLALSSVLDGLEAGIPGDLLAIDMRRALFHLGEITGEISTDDILGSIFAKFCIGK